MKTFLVFIIVLGGLVVTFYSCPDVDETNIQHTIHTAEKKTQKKPVVLPKPDTINIAAVGDIMLGTSYPDKKTLPPDSGKNSFNSAINELKAADVTFGNLEGALADTGTPAYYKLHLRSKAWLFRMPVYCGRVLKAAGFNVVSLANNHIGDFGPNGIKSTMKVLDSLGINYGGQLSHPTAVFNTHGATLGFCAFAPNSNTLSILNLKKAGEIIRQLKQRCDIVIVSFHGGAEGAAFEHVPFAMESFSNEKRGDIQAFAHNAVDAGADLVFGNGPHVCRAMELYNNRLVAYSLGNFFTCKSVSIAGVCGYAPMLKVSVNKKGEFLNARILSYLQTHDKGLQPDSLNHASKRIQELTQTDFPQSGLSFSDDGFVSKSPVLAAASE